MQSTSYLKTEGLGDKVLLDRVLTDAVNLPYLSLGAAYIAIASDSGANKHVRSNFKKTSQGYLHQSWSWTRHRHRRYKVSEEFGSVLDLLMLKSIHLVQKYLLPAEVTWKLLRITSFYYNCSSSTHTFRLIQRLALPLNLFTVFRNSAGLLRVSLPPPKLSCRYEGGQRKRQAEHQYITFPYFSSITLLLSSQTLAKPIVS